jgi:hypothetical protein
VAGFTSRASAAPADVHAIASGVSAQQMASAEVKSPAQAEQGALPALPLGDALEVSVGSNGLFSFSDVSTQISLFAEGRYRLTSLLQVGLSLTYRYQSTESVSSSAFQGLAGPVFNFALGSVGRGSNGKDGIENSFFVSPKVGLTSGQTKFGTVVVGSSSEPTFALTLGKRFALSESVAYAPSIGVIKELHFSPNFTIQPLALSVFF